ncbi:MAG: hypothetical protein HY363_00085, partial [Candidatus Aenigmarchaeota archaeon]|nr:hypothetical protein [Candidatus Aenigmarchaeota archaeon]
LNTLSLFYEKLYVYLITKNKIAKKLDDLGIQKLSFLGLGKRKIVYKGTYAKKEVVIKIKRPDTTANPIPKEVKMLALLSKKKLAPKVLAHGKDFFVAEFVPGLFLKDWLVMASALEIKFVLGKVFEWCYLIDKMKISKEEMHHPLKHVLIDGKQIGMIDFERAHETKDPKNVSQFVQFAINYKPMLKGMTFNREELIEKTKEYKKTFGRKEFEEILEMLKIHILQNRNV